MAGRVGKKVLWITELVFDQELQKTTQLEIMRYLAQRGNDVYLFGTHSRKLCQSNDQRVHVCSLPMRQVQLIRPFLLGVALFLFMPIYLLLKKPRYIIVGAGLPILALVWKPLLSFCTKSKVVLDIRSPPVEAQGISGCLRTLVFDISLVIAKRLFDGITTLTGPMRETISAKYNIDPRWIEVSTSGVSTSLFDPSRFSQAGPQLRGRNDLVGKFVVLYHGTATARRGIVESVESIEIVRREYNDVVLFLLVNGSAVSRIRELVRKRGLQDNVIVHDAVDYIDVPKYISMCDVGLVPLPNTPDWKYQCPLNLLEYLAMKKPVVLVDIPANRAIVGEAECGIYVRSADPADIADGILYARAEKGTIERKGAVGRVLVKGQYDWSVVAERLEDYLAKCTRRAG
jgi:glycosyltransferase involved in cell wall biosynthesis